MTAAGARVRANQIRNHLNGMLTRVQWIETQVAEAYRLKDHEALGYESWADYCATEYGAGLARLGVSLRKTMRTELTMAGASTGEIAAACGVDRKTIQRDVQRDKPATNVAPDVGKDLPPEPATNVAPVKRTHDPPEVVAEKQRVRGIKHANERIRDAASQLGRELRNLPRADETPETTDALAGLAAVIGERLRG